MHDIEQVPIDVLLAILYELSVRDRQSLYSLLFVSRAMNALAIPILYEDIRIAPKHPYFFECDRLHELVRLHSSIEEQKRVHHDFLRYTKKFTVGAMKKLAVQRVSPILRATLPRLIHVKYLAIHPLADSSLLLSLPPSVQITRLSLGPVDAKPTFLSFLERQHGLQVLNVPLRSPPLLSPNSLPCLRTTFGTPASVLSLVKGRPVEHIHIIDVNPSDPPVRLDGSIAAESFRGIRTLSARRSTIHDLLPILPHLPNVEFMRLELSHGATPPPDVITRMAPSTKLRYFRLVYGSTELDQSFVPTLFATFARLILVDLRKRSRPSPKLDQTYRYARWSASPWQAGSEKAPPDVWDHWWMPFVGAIEEAEAHRYLADL